MLEIKQDINIAKEECTFLQEWIDIISKNFINKQIDESKLDVYYTYGSFVSKSKNSQDTYLSSLVNSQKLLFNDRLEEELSKTRVDVCLSYGKFIMKTRIGIIPKSIRDIVTEITKIKMMIEFDFHRDENIKNSIPNIDKNVKIHIIKDDGMLNFDPETQSFQKIQDEEDLNMDDILDKISSNGIDSLTESERKFLDNVSKNL